MKTKEYHVSKQKKNVMMLLKFVKSMSIDIPKLNAVCVMIIFMFLLIQIKEQDNF